MFNSLSKILIIRRDNIGDLVCTTPAIAALRKKYPEAEIAVLVNSYNAQVLHGNPDVDCVFAYEKIKHVDGFFNRINALISRLKLIRRLRRWKPDVTVLAKSSYDYRGLSFARKFRAKNVIGYLPNEIFSTKFLPDIAFGPPEFDKIHEVEAINGLLKPLGVEDALDPLRVFPESKHLADINIRLHNACTHVALHISAREEERRWGVDNFIALASKILESSSAIKIMLFWSPGRADNPRHPGDDDAAEQLTKVVRSDRVIPMPTHNLTELISALSLCDFFIGADGGALHLAVALNKPCVALFENLPAKLNHWYPWRVPCRVVHGEKPEVASIELGAVKNALAELMAETGK